MSLTLVNLIGHQYGIASDETAINVRSFKVAVAPQFVVTLERLNGSNRGACYGPPITTVDIEGETNSTGGLLAATCGSAFTPANSTSYFGSSGSLYFEGGDVTESRDGFKFAHGTFVARVSSSTVTYVGDTSFAQSAKASWGVNGWELDTLTVPMRGAATLVDTFTDTLERWSTPSSISGANHMRLDRWESDNHPQYPTVTLHYIGSKSGDLPPDKQNTGSVVSQATFTTYGGSVVVNITYRAPTSSKRVIRDEPIELDTIGAPEPINVELIRWDSNLSITSMNAAGYGVEDSDILDLFYARAVTTHESEELVPGEYWSGTETKTMMLFSKQA